MPLRFLAIHPSRSTGKPAFHECRTRRLNSRTGASPSPARVHSTTAAGGQPMPMGLLLRRVKITLSISLPGPALLHVKTREAPSQRSMLPRTRSTAELHAIVPTGFPWRTGFPHRLEFPLLPRRE